LLGADTGGVIWSNYETRHYYFPVQFRDGLERPDAAELERLSLQDDPRDASRRAEGWERLLREYHRDIDVLIVWGSDPVLDRLPDRWFRPVATDGPLHVLKHR
jgi:hypothetical protein